MSGLRYRPGQILLVAIGVLAIAGLAQAGNVKAGCTAPCMRLAQVKSAAPADNSDGLPLPKPKSGGGSGLSPTTPLGGTGTSPSTVPAPGTGLGPTMPLGVTGGSPADQPGSGTGLGPTAPLGGTFSSQPGNQSASKATCGGTQSAPVPTLTLDQIVGTWTDSATGEKVEIKQGARGIDSVDVTLVGRNSWQGSFKASTLTFSRIPTAEQLGDAPDWAKQQVAGKVKWELELDAKDQCGEPLLEGKWYPGSYKWSETIDPDSTAEPTRTVSDIGRGTPVDQKYTRPPPAISDVIVLNDQTALLANGQPKWPFSEASGGQRLLFVYGRSLPRSWSDKIEFTSDDPAVKYVPIALSSEPKLPPLRQEQFATGWEEARKNLDTETISLTKDLNAVLVLASTRSGVLPGLKQFKLNGLDASWRLRFGDDRASLSFMREISEDVADPANALFLPERVFLELRTAANFPVEAVPLKVGVNGATVTWSGEKTIVARRTAPGVYRTDFIEFTEAGMPTPAAEKGVFFLPAHVKDEVDVRLEDPFLFGITPASLVVHLRRTPAELGETWKEALTRAAKADGIKDFSDWGHLSASKATEISNYIVTPIILKVVEYSTPLTFLRYVPKAYKFVEGVEAGKLKETTPVTVGEHAALLLFRDQFVKGMTAALKNLDQIKGEVALRGFREAIKYSAWDETSPWRYLQVSCPGGPGNTASAGASLAGTAKASGECSYPMAVSDYYLERAFGKDRRAADAWVRQATDEAIRNYRQAAEDAIAKAKGIEDKDIPELMKLVGYSYHPMLPALQARMMRLAEVGDPKRQLWVPDRNGRYELRNLHTVIDAVQAQKDYSTLDTQMAMLMAAAATAPFMLEEGVVAAVVMWGSDTAFLGISLATDVPEFIRSREEVRFALGASMLLGTQRLQEAELKETKWYQLLASVGPAALGSVLSTVRMVGVVRTSLILKAVENGGLTAYQALSASDKAAFWRFATEAKLLDELGETKALTNMHRRAIAAADDVVSGMKGSAANIAEIKPKPSIAALGEPGPAPKSEAKTLKLPANADSQSVVLREGGSGSANTETAAAQSKTKSLTATGEPTPSQPKTTTPKAGDETVGLTNPDKPSGSEPTSGQPKTKALKAGDETVGLTEPNKPPTEKPTPEKPKAASEPEPAKSASSEPQPRPKPPERTPTLTYGAEKPNVQGVMPEAKKPWPTIYKGKARTFQLGKFLGGGEYARVFELVDSGIEGCEKGCAIKIVLPDPTDAFFGSDIRVTGEKVNVAENIQYCSKLVDDAKNIPQLRNLEFYPDAPIPYFIQEIRQSNQAQFANMAEFKAAAAKIPDLRKAAVELAYKLKEHGLIMEDFKVNNLVFWKDTEGKWGPRGEWIAGILDHDRIIRFADRNAPGNMGAWVGFIEATYFPENLASMRRAGKGIQIDNVPELVRHFRDNPGPYFRDIDLFWEKEFEAKKWLGFDEQFGGHIEGGLTPADVERRFPRLRDSTRLDPFDPGIEFNVPRQGSWLNVVPFAPRTRVARQNWHADLRRAA